MQTKITRSARGQDCLIRIPGYCSWDPATVVHAHKNGGGMAMKVHDALGARSCSSCHDVVDFRTKTHYSKIEIEHMFYEGIFRTQLALIDEGLILIK